MGELAAKCSNIPCKHRQLLPQTKGREVHNSLSRPNSKLEFYIVWGEILMKQSVGKLNAIIYTII